MRDLEVLIKAGGFKTPIKFDKQIYDEKQEMWKVGEDYYWVESGKIICKMTNSHKLK